MKLMHDVDLAGKRVLIRSDLNVPVHNGVVTSDARIRASLPTYRQALDAGAAVMVLSHLGRPEAGCVDPDLSLAPVAEAMTRLLGVRVPLITDWIDGVEIQPGQIVLLENVRFLAGEMDNDEALAGKMVALCDVFVMDAFATAHRAQASTEAVIRHARIACAGPLLAAEVSALDKALADPARPLVAIVGGAKISGKVNVLKSLINKVDQLIVGGGIANTFLAAAGYRVGHSLYEAALIETARTLEACAQARGAAIPLPTDVLVAERFHQDAHATLRNVTQVHREELILDIGPDSTRAYAEIIRSAGTVIWNGPLGVFEFEAFRSGTQSVAQAVADCPGFTLAGGGDTIAAIEKFGVADRIDYISTAGGAFLEYMEDRELPALGALASRSGEG